MLNVKNKLCFIMCCFCFVLFSVFFLIVCNYFHFLLGAFYSKASAGHLESTDSTDTDSQNALICACASCLRKLLCAIFIL